MSDRQEKLDKLKQNLALVTAAQLPKKKPKKTPETTQSVRSRIKPQESPPASIPVSTSAVGQKLQALSRHLGMTTADTVEAVPLENELHYDVGEFEVDKVLPGMIEGDEERGFFLRRQDFPLDYMQGIIDLGAALHASPERIAFSANDPKLAAFDPRKALFMDTETTGLAGGAGTVAFLVGVGYFTEDTFRLDQCFMRDYDDEEPMLDFLSALFESKDTIVSYNGKSFDMPLLTTRFTQSRVSCKTGKMGHYDLVHAARRFWKKRLGDCSLGNIEREVLGLQRHGDVPGYLIPQMWLDYLNYRDARPLKGVFYHHEMDILSLVALTGWLSRSLDPDTAGGFEHAEDRLSVVRVHYRQKNYEKVIHLANAFLEEGEEGTAMRREDLEMLAMAYKRRKQYPEMQETWELLLREFPADLVASHELAKFHEHRSRDLLQARALCQKALDRIAMRSELHNQLAAGLSEERAFRKRLERIEQKLHKGGWTED
jgi:hypothetical protein